MSGPRDEPILGAAAPVLLGEAALGLRVRSVPGGAHRGASTRLDLLPLRAELGLGGLRWVSLTAAVASPAAAIESLEFRGIAGNTDSDELVVARSSLWAPYALGSFAYDPLGALAETLERLRSEQAGERSAEPGAEDAALALWARLELDLVRFARDELVRKACDAARGDPERARFAAFNDLARDLVKAILPWGVAPRHWNAWLRGEAAFPAASPGAGRLRRTSRRLDPVRFRARLLSVLIRSGRGALEAWTEAGAGPRAAPGA